MSKGCPITETKHIVLRFHAPILSLGEPGSLGMTFPIFRSSHLYKRLLDDGGHKDRQNLTKDLLFLLKSETTLKLDSLKKNTSWTGFLKIYFFHNISSGKIALMRSLRQLLVFPLTKCLFGWQFLAQNMGQNGYPEGSRSCMWVDEMSSDQLTLVM